MSLYRTQEGRVTHADEVPYIRAVPSKRDANAAFISLVSKLTYEQIDDLDREVKIVRDFLLSR